MTADPSVRPAADPLRHGGAADVVYADAHPTAMADLVGRLLEGNLAAHPERTELVRRATIEIRATDAHVAVVLLLSPGRILLGDPRTTAAGRRRDLVIAASSTDLLSVAGAPLLAGLPDPRRRAGRAVLGAIATRRIRISGIVRRLGTVRRFARLLSVADDGGH